MIILTLTTLGLIILLLTKLKGEQGLTAPKSYVTKLRTRPRSSNY